MTAKSVNILAKSHKLNYVDLISKMFSIPRRSVPRPSCCFLHKIHIYMKRRLLHRSNNSRSGIPDPATFTIGATMAKILSHNWSSALGSVGGITYFNGPAGSIIARARTKPVQAPSNLRTDIKGAMITRAAQWNAITEAQRAAWNVYAAAKGLINGRDAFLAGTIFLQYVVNANFALPTVQDNAPDNLLDAGCSVTLGTPTAAGTDAVAVKIQNAGSARVLVLFNISTGLNPARHFWKGPWNDAMTKATLHASGVTTTYEFPGLTVGQRYFIRTAICTNDLGVGLRGAKLQQSVITNSLAVHVP